MNPTQIELARHALGLPSKDGRSYRNRFCAGIHHPDYAHWVAMVVTGDAILHDGKSLPFGGDDLFELTRQGATAALHRGEQLDVEDFPEIVA